MLHVICLVATSYVLPPLHAPGRASSCIDRKLATRARPSFMEEVMDDMVKYGHDPRDNLEAEAYAADAAFAASLKSGSVGKLTNVGELQAAIDAAGSTKLVVYKFKREGCVACAETVEAFAAAAKEYGDQGLFFEVPFEESKAFCKQCETKFVPAVHVYSNGQLQLTSGLGKKVPWDSFKPRLDECRNALS